MKMKTGRFEFILKSAGIIKIDQFLSFFHLKHKVALINFNLGRKEQNQANHNKRAHQMSQEGKKVTRQIGAKKEKAKLGKVYSNCCLWTKEKCDLASKQLSTTLGQIHLCLWDCGARQGECIF